MSSTVSFIIPVFNEATRIECCLNSIQRQERGDLEVEIFTIDGGSTDATLEVIEKWNDANEFSAKILINERKIAEFGKALAIKEARGDYIILLDGDNELVGEHWLQQAVAGMEAFPECVGFESHYLSRPDDLGLNHFLTTCLHISDSLAWFIAAKPERLSEKLVNGQTYQSYSLPLGYPCGANGFIYRRSAIKRFLNEDTFEEGQITLGLAQNEGAHFIMADGVGVHHDMVDGWGAFIRKRAKIALKHRTRSQEKASWVQYTPGSTALAVIYFCSVLVPFIDSLFRAIRSRDIRWLYHAPVGLLTILVYSFCTIQNKLTGRKAW